MNRSKDDAAERTVVDDEFDDELFEDEDDDEDEVDGGGVLLLLCLLVSLIDIIGFFIDVSVLICNPPICSAMIPLYLYLRSASGERTVKEFPISRRSQ